jgi:metal-sulfur cluster biosynthetic enzyme
VEGRARRHGRESHVVIDEASVYEALEDVYDTCSLFNRTNLNIVEMGLVRDVEQREGTVYVRLLLTDPMCVYFFEIAQQVERVLKLLPGVDRVKIESTTDKLWEPDRIAPAARDRLARLRAERLAQLRARTVPVAAKDPDGLAHS